MWTVRAMVQFDLSNYRGRLVESARLHLYVDNALFTDSTVTEINIHAANHSWDELQASWKYREESAQWPTAGGTLGAKIAQLPFTSEKLPGNQWVTVELDKSVVQEWLNDPASNKGMIIKPLTGETSGRTKYTQVSFRSSEHREIATRPRLELSLGGKEIAIQANGKEIADGQTEVTAENNTNFGYCEVGKAAEHKFIIKSIGSETISIEGDPRVVISGADADMFKVVTEPSDQLEPGKQSEFTISYTATKTGRHSATVSIANNDPDESSYDFVIQGFGVVEPVTNNSDGARNIGGRSATLQAVLEKGAAAEIHMFYGTTDGGTDVSKWDHCKILKDLTQGKSSGPITGLDVETTYYYRCLAMNVAGSSWSDTTAEFKTLPTAFAAWAHSCEITVVDDKRIETLKNFPILVRLSKDNISGFDYEQFKSSGGSDLRFSDGSDNELAFEIDTWDEEGVSSVWVKVPELTPSTKIYAYWGRVEQQLPPYAKNGEVWSEGFSAVWHLNNTQDSKALTDDLETYGIDKTIGTVGNAWALVSDESDYAIIPNLKKSTEAISGSAWVKAHSRPCWASVLKNWGNATKGLFHLGLKENAGTLDFQVALENGETVHLTESESFPLNKWQHIAFTADGSHLRLYRNGEIVASREYSGPLRTPAITESCIGAKTSDSGDQPDPSYPGHWDGDIDEIRISSQGRSPAWIWATWMNTKSDSTFCKYSAVKALAMGTNVKSEIPDNIASALKEVEALSVYTEGKLDEKSAEFLKQLDKDLPAFNLMPHLFIARIDVDHPPAGWGAAGMSRNVEFTPVRIFRGDMETGKKITMRRSNPDRLGRRDGKKTPGLKIGGYYIIESRDNYAYFLRPASEQNVSKAALQGKVPLGWSIKDGKLYSPFKFDKSKEAGGWVCFNTGIAPILVPDDIAISCKPVPPEVNIKWTNPDGDGLVTITVKNTGQNKIDLPALKLQNGKIDWKSSLIVVPEGLKHPFQPLKTVSDKTEKTFKEKISLEPGEEVQCEAQILDLDEIRYGGGFRIYFTFCLGNKSTTLSFYWTNKHHTKLRDELLAKPE